jgi:hypothetical protein
MESFSFSPGRSEEYRTVGLMMVAEGVGLAGGVVKVLEFLLNKNALTSKSAEMLSKCVDIAVYCIRQGRQMALLDELYLF